MALDLALLLFAVLAIGCHLASLAATASKVRPPKPQFLPFGTFPAVSIVRPVCGIESTDELTLGSGFLLDYPQYELIFCCAQASDPAAALVRRLMAAHPDVPARLLIGDDNSTSNPKLNNVIKGWEAAQSDWIVLADSNVLMPPHYLQGLFASWRPDTGLVCSPPIGCGAQGFWAELECAFLNTYQARWQYFADALGYGFAQGKTMLWPRQLLEQAGGIRALGSEVAEDAASTKIVRGLGYKVRLVVGPFGQPLGERRPQQVWNRQLRWARLRRVTFPLHFLPELLTGIIAPAAAIAISADAAQLSLPASLVALFIVWYGGEALLSMHAGWHLTYMSPIAWLLRDLALPVLWVQAWFGNSLSWRGNEIPLGSTGASRNSL